jgi:hypothetical protein
MANYCATARSNYFRVKDDTASEGWCNGLHLEFAKNQEREYAILGIQDEGGWPSSRVDPESHDVVEIEFEQELAGHLADDYVAVLMEAGHEASRYVTGRAIAINTKGEIKSIHLDQIYELAKEMGKIVTEAAY